MSEDPAMDEIVFDQPPSQTWSGPPLPCLECGGAGVPVMTGDGWRMPLHPLAGNPTINCAGSLAAVEGSLNVARPDVLIQPDIAEQQALQEIPDASRLVE